MKKKGLKFRLLLTLIPVTAVGVLLLGVVSQISISALVQRHSAEQALQMLEQTERSMQQDIRQYLYTASAINHDPVLQQHFAKLYTGRAEAGTPILIRERLESYFNYSDRFVSVIFLFRDNQMYHYLMQPEYTAEEIKAMDWYRRCMEQNQTLHILGQQDRIAISNYSSYMFSMAYRPQPSYWDTGVELIYIALVDGTFENIYKTYEQGTGARIVILDEEGDVVGGRERDAGEALYRELAQAGRFAGDQGYFRLRHPHRQMITYYRSELTGWTLLHVIDDSILDDGASWIALLIITLSLAVILLFCTVAYWRVGRLTRPLEQLTVRMRSHHGRPGANIVVEPMPGGDESRQLEVFFQQMEQEINQLLREVETTEREKAGAQIAALQYQISPHFVLNTLNAIRTLAITTGADNRVREMLLSFSRMLSGCLSDVSDTHTLRQEREYLVSYLNIMKLRYDARWAAEITIPPELEEAVILKYLLQPLAENSILHGLSSHSGEARLLISAESFQAGAGSVLRLTVSDNGVGIPQEKIRRIMAGLEEKSSGFTRVGLHNVQQRIRLNYPGREYGMKIQSDARGTRIDLLLPLIENRTGRGTGDPGDNCG